MYVPIVPLRCASDGEFKNVKTWRTLVCDAEDLCLAATVRRFFATLLSLTGARLNNLFFTSE